MQELEDCNYAWLIYLIMYGLPFQALRLSVIKMLPTELINRIFSFLQGDTSALNACSSAHPVYSRLAERYLYADLQISPFAVSGLHEQISKNPHLLDYVFLIFTNPIGQSSYRTDHHGESHSMARFDLLRITSMDRR